MIPPLHNALPPCRRRYARFSYFERLTALRTCGRAQCEQLQQGITMGKVFRVFATTAVILVLLGTGSRFASVAPVTAAP
jgi:hypothetical protein